MKSVKKTSDSRPSARIAMHSEPAISASDRAKKSPKLIRPEMQPVSFIDNPEFKRKNAGQKILEAPCPERTSGRLGTRKRPKEIPAYLGSLYEIPLLTAEQEVYLFRKMNYLKYLASQLQQSIHPTRPSAKKLEELRQLLDQADRVRNEITQANLRLVVSISRRFTDPLNSFDDLVGEGNISLMYAVEKFDYSKGFRFSTYATHAIQRSFYRSINRRQKENQRFYLGASDDQFVQLPASSSDEEQVINPDAFENLYRRVINEMGQLLDDRERFILMARFGLEHDGQEQTLKLLAEQLGICKERVRQLQNRALVKLQDAAQSIMAANLLDNPTLVI